MSSDGNAVSILLAAGLVLAAVYLVASLGSSGPTGAAMAAPGTVGVLFAGLVVVLAATALWYRTFHQA